MLLSLSEDEEVSQPRRWRSRGNVTLEESTPRMGNRPAPQIRPAELRSVDGGGDWLWRELLRRRGGVYRKISAGVAAEAVAATFTPSPEERDRVNECSDRSEDCPNIAGRCGSVLWDVAGQESFSSCCEQSVLVGLDIRERDSQDVLKSGIDSDAQDGRRQSLQQQTKKFFRLRRADACALFSLVVAC